jgi:hypothetical protein
MSGDNLAFDAIAFGTRPASAALVLNSCRFGVIFLIDPAAKLVIFRSAAHSRGVSVC